MKTIACDLGGLGDNIVISGATVCLSQNHGEVRIPCYYHNLVSTRSFYVSQPNVQIWPISNHAQIHAQAYGDPDAILAGYTGYFENQRAPGLNGYKHYLDGEDLGSWMYRQLGVDWHHRWTSCPIPEAATHVEQLPIKAPVFVHEDPLRGFNISPRYLEGKEIFRPDFDIDKSILRYREILENSEEIHVINSSFWHLVESLEPKGKLFLHKYARPQEQHHTNFVRTRLDWTVINEP